jgi:hypothetical protein
MIIMNPIIGFSPITLKSFGLEAYCENTDGFDPDFKNKEINNGIAPREFAAIRITTIIKIYLQKLFLPLNVDSRWFIVKI